MKAYRARAAFARCFSTGRKPENKETFNPFSIGLGKGVEQKTPSVIDKLRGLFGGMAKKPEEELKQRTVD